MTSIAVSQAAMARSNWAALARRDGAQRGHGAFDGAGPAGRTAARVAAPAAGPAATLQQASLNTERGRVDTRLGFDLTTADGDRVHVAFASSDRWASGHLGAQDGAGNAVAVDAQSRSVQRSVAISVSGDLDDEELRAIDAVASQVFDIAADFLAGDDDGAIARARELRIDGGQIASFSLQLAQRSERTVTSVRSGPALAYGAPASGARGDFAGGSSAGGNAAASFALRDAGFAAAVGDFAARLRDLIAPPDAAATGGVDVATRAQLAAGLLPVLLDDPASAGEGSSRDAPGGVLAAA